MEAGEEGRSSKNATFWHNRRHLAASTPDTATNTAPSAAPLAAASRQTIDTRSEEN